MEDGGPPLLTALSYAASKGYTAIVEMLLKQGSHVNARASDGSTALMWAAKHSHPETARALLIGGADPRAIDKAGKTALDYATMKQDAEVAALLEKALSSR